MELKRHSECRKMRTTFSRRNILSFTPLSFTPQPGKVRGVCLFVCVWVGLCACTLGVGGRESPKKNKKQTNLVPIGFQSAYRIGALALNSTQARSQACSDLRHRLDANAGISAVAFEALCCLYSAHEKKVT
jgi:hypothetical protein